MLPAPPRVIELPRCRLARWEPAHVDVLRTALVASDEHLRPWTPWVIDGKVAGQTLEERLAQHAERFEDGVEWVYGIFSPDGTQVLGGAGLYPRVGPRAVELGYWLAVGHTGRGLATEAAAALTDVAFASPEIDHVEIRCERRNAASARVPERLGYTHTNTIAATATTRELMVWTLRRGKE